MLGPEVNKTFDLKVNFRLNKQHLHVDISNNCIESVFELSDLQNIEIADFEE